MSIRVKLILTYLLLFFIATSMIFVSGASLVERAFNSGFNAVFSEDIPSVISSVVDIITDIKAKQQVSPESINDVAFIEQINSKLNFFHGGLIVITPRKVINPASMQIDADFLDFLDVNQKNSSVQSLDDDTNIGESILAHNKYEKSEKYEAFEDRYFILSYEFLVEGGMTTYYFIVDTDKIGSFNLHGGVAFLSMLAGVILLITLPMIYIITKDIIRPVKELEKGVQRISDGDLNFKLKSNKKNELGRVIRSFDTMRYRLKESVDARVAGENNRKVFISSIGHDLKTPMTSIKGYIAGINEGIANTPEKQQQYLNVIAEKVDVMDTLINDLFMYSKLGVSELKLKLNAVNLNHMLQALIERERVGFEDDAHVLYYEPMPENILVEIDEKQMDRVFTNIIQNSKNYAKPAGVKIRVMTRLEQQRVKIVFSDDGIGIEKNNLEHIFESFYRVDKARNSAISGSGLGLAIAKQIIDAHGGEIIADSQFGRGTTLIIYLNIGENDA